MRKEYSLITNAIANAKVAIEEQGSDNEQISDTEILAYRRLRERAVSWGPILDTAGALLPSSMYFSQMVFDGKALRFRGYGTASDASGELESFQSFVDSLKNTPVIKRVFAQVTINSAQQQLTNRGFSVIDFDVSASLRRPVRK